MRFSAVCPFSQGYFISFQCRKKHWKGHVKTCSALHPSIPAKGFKCLKWVINKNTEGQLWGAVSGTYNISLIMPHQPKGATCQVMTNHHISPAHSLQPFSSFPLLNLIVASPSQFILIGKQYSVPLNFRSLSSRVVIIFVFLHSGVNIALQPSLQSSLKVLISLIMSSRRSFLCCHFK